MISVAPRKERLQHARIEVFLPRSSSMIREALVERKRRLVRSLAARGIEDVGHRGDPALQRDVFARQPERVAAAVPFLVMGQGDAVAAKSKTGARHGLMIWRPGSCARIALNSSGVIGLKDRRFP